MFYIIQYNRTGITDVDHHARRHGQEKQLLSQNVSSIIRLFLAIMVFVVIVLTIAR